MRGQGGEGSVEAPAERIEVVVSAAGKFYVNDQELVKSDVESLQNALFRVSGGRNDLPLTLRADAQTTHQSFVTVLDAAGKLGMNRISIAASRTVD